MTFAEQCRSVIAQSAVNAAEKRRLIWLAQRASSRPVRRDTDKRGA